MLSPQFAALFFLLTILFVLISVCVCVLKDERVRENVYSITCVESTRQLSGIHFLLSLWLTGRIYCCCFAIERQSNGLLRIYIYTHKLVLLSTWIRSFVVALFWTVDLLRAQGLSGERLVKALKVTLIPGSRWRALFPGCCDENLPLPCSSAGRFGLSMKPSHKKFCP